MNLQDFRGLNFGSNEYSIWYMRPEYFWKGSMGTPVSTLTQADLEGTHILLGTMLAEDTEDVFYKMQGENWSPNGEARTLIATKGLSHTSMSIGDIVIEAPGKCFLCDVIGFKEVELIQPQESWGLEDTQQEQCPKCGSEDLSNEGPPENGLLPVTCLGCGYQWHEPEGEDDS